MPDIDSPGTGARHAADRLAAGAAALAAAAAFAVSVGHGVFSANHADASGYVAAGESWRTGTLYRPVPLQLWASWPNASMSGSPLGFRPSLVSGVEVPVYPLGFPLLIAAAVALAGPLGAYLVAPLAYGILVWCAFLLGHRLAGAATGFVAATLVAFNPVVLRHSVHPMSDVPAAAAWTAAWALALRGTTGAAVASGAVVTLAAMIRPNLLPLALVPGLLVLLQQAPIFAPRRWAWGRAAAFGAAAAVGPLVAAWSQATLYGSPTSPGYPGWKCSSRPRTSCRTCAPTRGSSWRCTHGGRSPGSSWADSPWWRRAAWGKRAGPWPSPRWP